MKSRTCLYLLICLLAVPTLASTDANSLEDAVLGGEFDLNLRVRAESVDADGTEDALAITERLRLGYGSKTYKDFSFYDEFEDIQALDDDRYNASGLNNNPTKATVADPEATELNQGYLNYHKADLGFNGRFGRQRIILDDARFIGNVGWRQNEQTFDAASFSLSLPFDVEAHYSYLWHINRIYGQSTGTVSTSDYDSDSHLFNVSTTDEALGTLTGFAYLLDFDSSPANSSDTFGLRYNQSLALSDEYSLAPVLSYAYQKDNNANPTNYDADYYLAQLSLKKNELGTIGVGYEVLGSDNGAMAFRTPLATGHAFNGWYDAFLTTPAYGLQDLYVFASTTLPCGTVAKIYGHHFSQDVGGQDLGDEVDAVLSKKLSDHVSVLVKYSHFNAKAPTTSATDGDKFWFQTEIKTN